MRPVMYVRMAVLVSCLALSVTAQDLKSEDQSAYTVLEKEEGVWDADVTMMIPGADGKVATSTSKGVETKRMLAGKWLISDFKGELLGSTFERHGTSGYDAKKNKFISTLVHTMSVSIDTMVGTYDEKTKTLTLYSDSVAPNGKPMKMRRETQFNDDGTRTYSVYARTDGQKEFSKGMEVKYTKRKS